MMKYFKFSKVLGAVASSLFLFCTCHASAMKPQQKAGTNNHGQENLVENMLLHRMNEILRECNTKVKSIKGVLEKKIDKIVIEESAKQELIRLGVENIDSIPIDVLACKFGIMAPAKKYLELGYGGFVPACYLWAVLANVEKCNSIKLLNHPEEGIVLACDNVAVVVRKKNVTVAVFGITRNETAFSLDDVECAG